MPINNLIQFRKGPYTDWLAENPVLASGEPGYDLTNKIFKIGDGVSTWTQLGSLNTNTIRGTFLVSSTTGTFSVSGGYNIGSLDVFLNGSKLSPSGDYTATNGTTLVLTETVPSGSVVEYIGLVPGFYIGGHSHTSSDITNFNSSVSGLLPVKNIIAGTGIVITSSDGSFTINATGVAGGGGGTIDGNGSSNYLSKWSDSDTLTNSIIYDNGSNIGISTISPSYKLDVVGTGNFSQNLLVNGTGVSLSGHTHTTSQITDFNTSFSGLLPVKDIVAGSGINVSINSGSYTINSTAPSAVTGYEILTTTKDTFSVNPSYLVGNLQVYYNGFKLLDGEDFTASNGTTFLLNSPGSSGDVVEWAGFTNAAQYSPLNHTHGNLSSSGTIGSTSGSFIIAGNNGLLTAYTGMIVNNNNELLIGTSTDNGSYLLQVNSQIYATNATIATSDVKYKTNINSLDSVESIINNLHPVTFDFIPQDDKNFSVDRQIGLIAQETQQALQNNNYANSVVMSCGDHLGIAYEKLIPLLIKGLQEAYAKIKDLEEIINDNIS